MPSLILPFLFTYFIFPSPLEAHILSASTSTFSAGFAHPFSGIDHLMAICATGLWAGQRGKFISMISLIIVIGSMFLGAMIGITGINLAIVDWGIGLSLFVLGTLLFFRHRTPLPRHSIFFLCCLIGCFFAFHGYSHGSHWHHDTSSWFLYLTGFLTSTAVIFLMSDRMGRFVSSQPFKMVFYRFSGAVVITAGILFIRSVLL